MKLRNMLTGEIVVFGEGIVDLSRIGCKNVADMMRAGWRDYDESFWYVNDMGGVEKFPPNLLGREAMVESHEKIGNYFETEEEAEKAVEKLKAWKRLKDKGFQFESWWGGSKDISFWLDTEIDEDIAKDLDLLFGDEE